MSAAPPPSRPRLALGHVFLAALAGVATLLGVLFYLILDSSRRTIIESSDRLRDSASLRIAKRVEDHLYQAERAISDLETALRHGALPLDDTGALEARLFAKALEGPALAEVTLVRTDPPDRHGELSIVSAREGGERRLVTRHTAVEDGRFVLHVRDRPPGAGLLDVPFERRGDREVPDPAMHLTVQTAARPEFRGEVLWSDLHWAAVDALLPEPERRVVVTAQKAVSDREGRPVGVLRVGLFTEEIDAASRMKVDEHRPADPHVVFICDARGRLVTRASPGDRLTEVPGDDPDMRDLRVVPAALPPAIGAALKDPTLHAIGSKGRDHASGRLVVEGRPYLATFRSLDRTFWLLGIVVPEDHYLGDLARARDRSIFVSAAVMVLILVGGVATLRAVRRGLRQVVDETGRMGRFEFDARPVESPFRDVEDALGSLELAKTALRAMGKYVPVDLVRLLYRTGREPVLGGELRDVSLLFTDVKGFTTLAESLEPNQLALVLGRYLAAMTRAIHENDGTVDKYIGDAVMAIWNAPRPCARHAEAACRATLACIEATRDLPDLHTRFGLHRAEVLVGHFGAPDRLSYTALGDGVNLAARLEGLNKQYGTTVLASEAIQEAAKEAFEFRLVDRVAVAGKTRGIKVYELLGPKRAGPDAASGRDVVVAYERAFEAYQDRRFEEALTALEPLAAREDGPSRTLATRCRALLAAPPPADWDGVHVATSK